MTNALRMSRKAFTVAVVAATIAWSIGLSALVTPLTARAASSGDLVKGSLSAVYYVGADGKRYVFPHEKNYFTWYSDFSGVMTITDAELAAMPIGGNVTYRPGVKMIKIQSDPKVYAVSEGGVLRWVTSEALAVQLYGADWNTKINDVSDAFFVNYTMGADITSSGQYDPAAETAGTTSINDDKNLGEAPSGTLSASMSSSGPSGATLPGGATNVSMLKFNVSNGGSSAATLDTLTVHRTGAGNPSDFTNVYVYEGDRRLTTGRTINTSTNQASFSSLGVSVPAGGMTTLWIAADMSTSAGAGNVHAIQLVDLKSGSTTVSGLPLTGPQFTMAAVSAGSVTITKSGTQPLPQVKAGGMNQKIAEFQLAAGSSEDIQLRRVTLFNGGAVNRSDVTNLTLRQGGQTLGSASGYDSNDRATIVLTQPLLMEKGNTKTFTVNADISAGARSGTTETILTYLDDESDLYAVGMTYGFGVTVNAQSGDTPAGSYDGASCTLSAGNCSSTSVEAGQLTMTFNGPAAKDVATNGKDVELFNFTMAAGVNLEIRQLNMDINSNGVGAADGLIDTSGATSVANFSDIKVVDTASGTTVAGPIDLATGGSNTLQTLTFTETWTLNAGSARTLKVTADIRNNTAAAFLDDTIRVDLEAFGTSDVRNLDNSTFLSSSDIVPSSGINGNTHTIKAPTLAAGVSSTPVAQTYIQGTAGATLAGFQLQAGDAADIHVNTLTLTGQVDTGTGTTNCTAPDGTFATGEEDSTCNSVAELVSTARLWNGSTQLGDTESPGTGTDGTLVFDNLNLTVPAGQTVSLKLTGDLASGRLSSTTTPDDLRWTIAAATSVSATDQDGNTVTVTSGGFPLEGAVMRIAEKGTLTLAKAPDDSESEADLVIGGTSNAVLAKYRLTAQNEELRLNKVRFNVATANTVSSLSLYDGATLVGGPVSVSGGGVADFNSANFVIPKDSSKTLTVKGNLNSVGTGGATTGTEATVTLNGTDAGTFQVRGTGSGSNTLITEADISDVAGNQKVVRKSRPTVSLVALPSTSLSNTSQVGMRFTVSADAAENVSLKKITAEVSLSLAGAGTTKTVASDGAGTSSIRRVGDGSNLAGTSALLDSGGASCQEGDTPPCTFTASFENEEVISAGTSRTYDLRIVVSGAAVVSGDTISIKLLGDTALDTGRLVVDPGVAGADDAPFWGLGAGAATDYSAYNFLWSDNSAVPHAACTDTNAGATTDCDDAEVVNADSASADWTNGLYVDILPSDTQTLSKS